MAMTDYLMHYGIPGQKRGIRRFQNEDGSLTPEGKKRYGILGRIPIIGSIKRNIDRKREDQKKKDAAERLAQYNEGYRYGRRWGIKTKYGGYPEQLIKEAEKMTRGDIIDRGVKKALDPYGFGPYSRIVSKKLKDTSKSTLIKMSKTESGQRKLQKAANVSGKGVSVGIDKAVLPAYDVTAKYAKEAPKYVAKGAKFIAKTSIKANKKAYKWLKEGGAEKIHKGADKTIQLVNRYGTMAYNVLETGVYALAGRKVKK